jgi:hypothetical protein
MINIIKPVANNAICTYNYNNNNNNNNNNHNPTNQSPTPDDGTRIQATCDEIPQETT